MKYLILILILIVIVLLIKATGNRGVDKLEASFDDLTDEQYAILKDTVIEVKSQQQHIWNQVGLVSSIKGHGSSDTVRVLWFNKVIKNDSYGQIAIAQIFMPKKEVTAHNLKVGDYVNLHMNPQIGASIVFDDATETESNAEQPAAKPAESAEK